MTKILVLMGIIPPYECEAEYSQIMLENYLLKAKITLPDLEWDIKEFEQTNNQEAAKGGLSSDAQTTEILRNVVTSKPPRKSLTKKEQDYIESVVAEDIK